jgi:hypothetical protein
VNDPPLAVGLEPKSIPAILSKIRHRVETAFNLAEILTPDVIAYQPC